MKRLCRDCYASGETAERRCSACGSPRVLNHDELGALSIAHMDCDAFYASVEKRDRPELRDEAVIVGGGTRGVVTTACYIARLTGVRSAMPMFQARKLCPHAVIIAPNFAKYRTESRRIFEKVRALTPLVQGLSLDEAWMDLSGTERLHGAAPAATLARLQGEIERDVGITVSIGLAANKFLAKIASDLDKPRGFAVIGAEEAERFLAPKKISIIPGVGPAFAKVLEAAGYRVVGDIAKAAPRDLADRFGQQGLRLASLAKGRDSRPVDPDQARKSISAENTFDSDLTRIEDLEDELWPLCERVAAHARSEVIAGRVVTLKLRDSVFRIVTRRKTLPIATQTARTLFQVGRELLKTEAKGAAYRLIGIGLSDLVDGDLAASDFFSGQETRALKNEKALDALRARFGAAAIVSARALKAGSPNVSAPPRKPRDS